MKKLGYVGIILSFLCGGCFLTITTQFEEHSYSTLECYGLLILFVLFYVVGNWCYCKVRDTNIVRQLCALNTGGTIVFVLLMVNQKNKLLQFGEDNFVLLLIAIGIIFTVTCVMELGYIKKNVALDLNALKSKKWIIALLFFVGLIAVFQTGSEPRWDGAYLFNYILERNISDLFNLQALQFCGHLSMGYIGANIILGYLFHNLELGMTAGNIILYLLSVYCMNGILKKTMPERRELCYTLLTAVYAFSPFMLGLVNYNYWDYWTIVLFPIIIYLAITEKWIYHFVISFFFIYTKETAFLSYAFWCIGMVFFDSRLRNKEISVGSKIKKLLLDQRYIGMMVLGLSWLIMWRYLPHWDGVGSFSFDFDYIIKKLEVFYVFNFNWVLSILSILFCILCKKKKWKRYRVLGPIIISDVAVVLFNCLFKTVNHPRYIGTHIVVLCLLASVGMGVISISIVQKIMLIVISCVLLISNYYSIDWLSRMIFDNYNLGTVLLSTSGEYFSDAMVYNQQYRYIDIALNKAMKEAVANDKASIYFPTINNNTWFFDGITAKFRYIDDVIIQKEFWDYTKDKRMAYENKNTIPIEICQLPENYPLYELATQSSGYYFYAPCVGANIRDGLMDNVAGAREEVFEYRGIQIIRVSW